MIEQSYKEWLELLASTNNEDLLQDPYNVWIEAFHVSKVLCQQDILTKVQAKFQPAQMNGEGRAMLMGKHDIEQLQLKTLQQILQIIEKA